MEVPNERTYFITNDWGWEIIFDEMNEKWFSESVSFILLPAIMTCAMKMYKSTLGNANFRKKYNFEKKYWQACYVVCLLIAMALFLGDYEFSANDFLKLMQSVYLPYVPGSKKKMESFYVIFMEKEKSYCNWKKLLEKYEKIYASEDGYDKIVAVIETNYSKQTDEEMQSRRNKLKNLHDLEMRSLKSNFKGYYDYTKKHGWYQNLHKLPPRGSSQKSQGKYKYKSGAKSQSRQNSKTKRKSQSHQNSKTKRKSPTKKSIIFSARSAFY